MSLLGTLASPLKFAGNAVGDILGFNQLKEKTPTQHVVDLDPGTKSLLDKQNAYTNQSLEDIQKSQLQGVRETGQQIAENTAQNLQRQNAGLGGAQPEGMQDALARRAQKAYGSQINTLERQSQLEAYNEKAKRQQQLASLYARKQSAISQSVAEANKSILTGISERNRVVNGIIGGIGSAAGAAAGAMTGIGPGAGAQAGGAIANPNNNTDMMGANGYSQATPGSRVA